MNSVTASILTHPRPGSGAERLLNRSAILWLSVALIGQWIFFYYITRFYGPSILTGNFAAWSRNKMLITGYVAGDGPGNLAFAAHVMAAAMVALGGTLQLIPAIRARAPAVHRWIGRTYLLTAMTASLAGLYMVWVRGTRLDMISAVAVSGNAAVIMTFAVLAWRAALRRDFTTHRRWALRTFMVAGGQWFFRVGYIAWMISTHGLGSTDNLTGPFDIFWSFGCYLVPLGVLELYMRAKDGGGPKRRLAMAATLTALSLYMSAGIVGVALFMYAPVLAKL